MCIYVYIGVYIYVCVCVCVSIYIILFLLGIIFKINNQEENCSIKCYKHVNIS